MDRVEELFMEIVYAIDLVPNPDIQMLRAIGRGIEIAFRGDGEFVVCRVRLDAPFVSVRYASLTHPTSYDLFVLTWLL